MAGALGMASYRILDDDGIYWTKEIFFDFDDTKTMANIAAFLNSYAAVLDAVTGGEIVQQSFRIIVPTAGLKGSPTTDAEGEEGMLTSYSNASNFTKWGDSVPALIEAADVNGKLDLANTDVAAYTAFMTTAHSGFTPSSRNGFANAALVSGMVTFRTKRRALNAKRSIPT